MKMPVFGPKKWTMSKYGQNIPIMSKYGYFLILMNLNLSLKNIS